MTTDYATSEPILPTETARSESEQNRLVGYQLCEFCLPRGIPEDNPSEVCECNEFPRHIAGWNRSEAKSEEDLNSYIIDTLRIAETAILTHWNPGWDDDVTITNSTLSGQCNDEYRVRIDFDGVLTGNLDTEFNSPDGVAKIVSINGDGTISIGVTLSEKKKAT